MNELDWYDATLPAELQGWSTINVTDGNANHPYAASWWPTGHILGYEHSFINQAADMLTVIAAVSQWCPLLILPMRMRFSGCSRPWSNLTNSDHQFHSIKYTNDVYDT